MSISGFGVLVRVHQREEFVPGTLQVRVTPKLGDGQKPVKMQVRRTRLQVLVLIKTT